MSRPNRIALVLSLAAAICCLGSVLPAGAAGLTVDKRVTTHQSAASTTITSPALTTTGPNELLLAFLASDGPASGKETFASVTGGGLTWRLRQRTNAQAGTAEIWEAVATAVLTNVTITATRGSGAYAGAMSVVAFAGANTTVDGAVATGSGASGAQSASLTTTAAGSWVWGVGDDWDQAIARTVGTGQTKVDEYFPPAGDTFWLQSLTSATPASGTLVTLNDTAPTTDRWDLSIIEVLAAASGDTIPPTAPTNLTATASSATEIDLSWTASTDNVGVTGYTILRNGTAIGSTTTAVAYADTTCSPNTAYTYTVTAHDAAGNVSAPSNTSTATTPADTTPPTISITAPAANATVSGTVTVSASASDNVGVASVQFLLDGANLGSAITKSPYSMSWDTTTATPGAHTLSATAADAAGNVGTAAGIPVTVSNGANPSQVGQWGPVIPMPAVNIHVALTPANQILMIQGSFTQGGQQYLYDVASGVVTQLPNDVPDLFCTGQPVLADGRILTVGGTWIGTGPIGITDVTAFDWLTSTWETMAPMNYPRWYPTGTTLSDGSVLAMSGDDMPITPVPIPEIYNVKTNTWTALPGASHTIPVYPFIYQLPNGLILHAGGSEVPTDTEVLNLTNQTWTTVDSRVLDGAGIVNYAPWKFIKAGTASDDGNSGVSASTAYTLDMSQPSPAWQQTSSMAYPRSFVNLTSLPDGTVLATGGATDKSSDIDTNAVLPAELWNPSTGTWTTMAAMSVPRMYHSEALLLPDGRIFVSGSGGAGTVTNELSAQFYSPPYLFKGVRPTITAAPSTVQYNSVVFVQTPDAATITRVSLMRTGSDTHCFDQNARAVPLTFTQTTGGINVQMPVDGNTAPPGYYMLFIVNNLGVPSVGAFVRFPAVYEDTTPPTAPTSLAAVGGVGSVSLSWGAATDNVGVTQYNIYRSTTSGFAPSTANQVGTTGGGTLAFTDSALAAGTYYYLVTAQDAAGNVGPPSGQASATATGGGSTSITVDKMVTTHQNTAATTITSPPLTTTGANELLVAFLASDGPTSGKQTFSSVTGAGLTWTLRQRANTQAGTAEIWTAAATGIVSNATVTATRGSGSFSGSMVVVAFAGANTTVSGATASASAASGAQSAALTTTRAASWSWGVGDDWDQAIARTVGSGQTKVDEYFPSSGDTFWVQSTTAPTPASGATVTINDTAPTSDRWNLAIIEIPGP